MNQLDNIFLRRKGLIAYLPVGYPSLSATLDLIPLLVKHGCDVVELGIPFSDPMADGTTIQYASQVALHNGITSRICLETVRKLKTVVDIPLLFMSYINPPYHFGFDDFCRESAVAGVSAFILPDVSLEEGEIFEKIIIGHGMYMIHMVAPTSTPERLRMIGKRAQGFIYMVALAGVTGARQELPALEQYIGRVRNVTKTPLCVGFGISTPEQAGYVAGMADGVIIGSRLIQLIDEDSTYGKLVQFIRKTRDCIDNPVGQK